MRAFGITTTVLSLCIVACDATPTAPSAVEPVFARSHAAVADVPIRGSCEATFAEPPVFTPPILRQVSTGTCQLSHLGRVRLRTVAEVNTAIGVQVAEITYTASSGDLLFATSIGTATPGPTGVLHFTGATTLTGGTGRFSGASGEMTATGTLDPATGNASFSYDGRITYAAADHVRR